MLTGRSRNWKVAIGAEGLDALMIGLKNEIVRGAVWEVIDYDHVKAYVSFRYDVSKRNAVRTLLCRLDQLRVLESRYVKEYLSWFGDRGYWKMTGTVYPRYMRYLERGIPKAKTEDDVIEEEPKAKTEVDVIEVTE